MFSSIILSFKNAKCFAKSFSMVSTRNMTPKSRNGIVHICTIVNVTVQPQTLIARMLTIHVANERPQTMKFLVTCCNLTRK